jgi:hypothetical protein
VIWSEVLLCEMVWSILVLYGQEYCCVMGSGALQCDMVGIGVVVRQRSMSGV